MYSLISSTWQTRNRNQYSWFFLYLSQDMSLPQWLQEQGKPGEFRLRTFKLSLGIIHSPPINGMGAGIRAGRTCKEKAVNKPCGKQTKESKQLLCQIVYSCAQVLRPHGVLKYCHRVPGISQRWTLERGFLR